MEKLYKILNIISRNRSNAQSNERCEEVLGHMENVHIFSRFWESNAELLEVLHQVVINEMLMEEDLSSDEARLVKLTATKSIMFFADCNSLSKKVISTSQGE